ncbi:cation diffusion facilitator family transporter [Streptomyces lasiicapitis]|uniref:cation diffusion facilitator family transporter n=1 Tax=Streptomyces lasiicapitis TaxID=1923961 RepID=UPI003691E7D2
MGEFPVGHAHTHHDGHDHQAGSHGGHSHGVSADADRRWLSLALVLIGVFISVETAIAFVSGSLALLSDAVHMLTDAFSIILALVAMRLAARPAKGTYTFGLKRVEILSAQANGLTLLLAAVWLGYEAVVRLLHPPEVTGWMVLATALTGVAVNLAAAWCLSKANRASLNVEGAYQHILNDLYAFIGTAVAGVVVMTTGFARADTIATLFVVVLMVKAGCGLLRDSGRILLEAAPAGLDPDAIGDRLATAPHVAEVHDLHIWTITSGEPALSAHVLVHPGGDCHAVRRDLDTLLAETYGLTHTTLQIDHEDPEGTTDHVPHPAAVSAPAGAGAAPHCANGHGPTHRREPHAH